MSCKRGNNGFSNWGCASAKVSIALTTEGDNIVFPNGLNRRWPWYNVNGFTSNSNELVLTNPTTGNKVEKGQTLRLWYGEDLVHYTETDNGGKSCADVYAKIEPGEWS